MPEVFRAKSFIWYKILVVMAVGLAAVAPGELVDVVIGVATAPKASLRANPIMPTIHKAKAIGHWYC
jgi:hypothetical protein